MAKAIREADGKEILHRYIGNVIKECDFELPQLKCAAVTPETDLQNLPQWLEKQVGLLLTELC